MSLNSTLFQIHNHKKGCPAPIEGIIYGNLPEFSLKQGQDPTFNDFQNNSIEPDIDFVPIYSSTIHLKPKTCQNIITLNGRNHAIVQFRVSDT